MYLGIFHQTQFTHTLLWKVHPFTITLINVSESLMLRVIDQIIHPANAPSALNMH